MQSDVEQGLLDLLREVAQERRARIVGVAGHALLAQGQLLPSQSVSFLPVALVAQLLLRLILGDQDFGGMRAVLLLFVEPLQRRLLFGQGKFAFVVKEAQPIQLRQEGRQTVRLLALEGKQRLVARGGGLYLDRSIGQELIERGAQLVAIRPCGQERLIGAGRGGLQQRVGLQGVVQLLVDLRFEQVAAPFPHIFGHVALERRALVDLPTILQVIVLIHLRQHGVEQGGRGGIVGRGNQLLHLLKQLGVTLLVDLQGGLRAFHPLLNHQGRLFGACLVFLVGRERLGLRHPAHR